jgi:hypothetical protein
LTFVTGKSSVPDGGGHPALGTVVRGTCAQTPPGIAASAIVNPDARNCVYSAFVASVVSMQKGLAPDVTLT